ncbi:MAG TPA: hypothetical protein VE987_06770 [Polyangiaceae bacterium]|nr:hypothetical protein [Polyangiaceae bacterium]
MSDTKKGDFNPNATIQLTLDEVQLAEMEARLGADRTAGAHGATPPPLPGVAAMPVAPDAPQAQRAAAAVHGVGRAIAYGVMVAALVAGAVAAGLKVGSAARRRTEAAPAAPTVSAPAGSSSSQVLTLPTIEMR